MSRVWIAIKALVVMSGFVWFWGWVALRVERLHGGLPLPKWIAEPGIVLGAIGLALALACVATFVLRGRGTPAPFDPPKVFVAVGPYRHVRNPMYIGAWILLIGFGLHQRSVAIVVFSALWLLIAHLFVICYEEPHLRREFGATYEAYCRAVPRWAPRAQGPAPHEG